jgi:hypothetical protein
MRDNDRDHCSCDRQNPHHDAAMRGVDGLQRKRHQKRKQEAHAEHRNHEPRPQPAGWQWPAQYDQQQQRAQPGNRRAQRRHCDRIDD